jgi:hypothetical protein
MRVPKGTLAHGQHEDNDDWESLVAQAKARADDEWEAAVSAAKARAERVQQDEERAWQEALARAKRIAQLESWGEVRVARQPARPPVRVPRRGAQGAFGPPRVMAPGQRAVAATAGTPSVNAGSVPGAAVYGGAAALDHPGALLMCSRAEPRASTEAADDVEWRLLRQRAEQRAQQALTPPRMVLDAAHPYSIFTPAPRAVPAPRVVAWP